eukprot:TRINITY_DN110843_c0_g1_i1.p1 TRINITY_DN110843_c0_g1~~TRINITY_DN110843_c0_g1_i1.p1  ORF type:complete len:254 (+),score=57.65 TRINITY_DN110843_c0_g1_i1:183-944(+)
MGVVDNLIGSVMDHADFGAHKNQCSFRLFILSALVVVCAHPLICYFLVAQNPHVVFWIGLTPQYVMSACMAATMSFFLFFEFLTCCTPSGKTTKVSILIAFGVCGGVQLGGGMYLASEAGEAKKDLTERCGQTPLTMQIQSTWSKLLAFHTSCTKVTGDDDVFLQQCPRFEEKFQSDVYVQYIEDLEYDFGCQGFCHYHAKPFFAESNEKHIVCSHVLGSQMNNVARYSAYPMAALGAFTLAVGGALASYEHL